MPGIEGNDGPTYGEALLRAEYLIEQLLKLRVTIEVTGELTSALNFIKQARTLVTDDEIQSFILSSGDEGAWQTSWGDRIPGRAERRDPSS